MRLKRKDERQTMRGFSRKFLLAAAIIFILLICALVVIRGTLGQGMYLWDLSVYVRAVAEYASGTNPYRTDAGLTFVYHPYVLLAFNLINQIIPLTAFLLAVYLGVTTLFFWRLVRFLTEKKLLRSEDRRFYFLALIFFATMYGGAGPVSVMSGNVTVFLHLVVCVVLLEYFRTGNQRIIALFAVVLIAAVQVKPYMLGYLVFLFYMLGFRYAVFWAATVTVVAIIVWFSARYTAPDLYQAFLIALTSQTIARNDLGYSAFGIFNRYLDPRVSLVTHVAVVAVAAYLLLLKIPAEPGRGKGPELFFMLAVVLSIFLNPRMKEYDFQIAVLFTFVFFYAWYGRMALLAVAVAFFVASVPFMAKVVATFVAPPPRIFSAYDIWSVLGILVILGGYVVRLLASGGKDDVLARH